jgi:hypothetical protein
LIKGQRSGYHAPRDKPNSVGLTTSESRDWLVAA